jgi:cell wall-associated NlpC family hydrolase
LTDLDPRRNAYRPNLADAALKGKVEASRFVAGRAMQVSTGTLPLQTSPSSDALMGSELLFGETVHVFETDNGWAWLQNQTDGYVGYAADTGLRDKVHETTHYVAALRTYRFSDPDLKSPVLDVLSMNSPLAVTAVENGFSALAAGGWVWTGHLAGPGEVETDHVAVALRFLGAPYRWGGRSSIGLDCSGLVQMALARCGKASPRDSDMQACESGAPVAFDGDYSVLRYGDHVIWPGHCGLYLDKDRFVHANATDMMVAIAPLAKVAKHIERIEGHRISAVRRP